MPISFRRPVFAGTTLLVPALLLCFLTLPASQAVAQETTPPTALEKQLAKFDLGLVAAGEISSPDSGIEQRDAHVVTSTTFSNAPNPGTSTTTSISSTLLNIKPSSTVGELATLRYTLKPYVGFEFNFGNLRYTQDYTFTTTTNSTTVNNVTNATTTATTITNPNFLIGGIQSGVRELTLGYVAHLKYHPLGIDDEYPRNQHTGAMRPFWAPYCRRGRTR